MMTFFITALNTVCTLTGNKDREKLKKNNRQIEKKNQKKRNQGKKREKKVKGKRKMRENRNKTKKVELGKKG